MRKIRLYYSIEGKYNFVLIKLRPTRRILLNPNKYAVIWNYIIRKILQGTQNHKLYVILTLNIFVRAKQELCSFIIGKIDKGEYEVLYEKKLPHNITREKFSGAEFFEHKYILSMKMDDLEFLVGKLNDKDALELLIAKHGIGIESISGLLEDGIVDISRHIDHCIYFNGIHIGLNIEMYNGDIALIRNIFKGLEESEDLNVRLCYAKQ